MKPFVPLEEPLEVALATFPSLLSAGDCNTGLVGLEFPPPGRPEDCLAPQGHLAPCVLGPPSLWHQQTPLSPRGGGLIYADPRRSAPPKLTALRGSDLLQRAAKGCWHVSDSGHY